MLEEEEVARESTAGAPFEDTLRGGLECGTLRAILVQTAAGEALQVQLRVGARPKRNDHEQKFAAKQDCCNWWWRESGSECCQHDSALVYLAGAAAAAADTIAALARAAANQLRSAVKHTENSLIN